MGYNPPEHPSFQLHWVSLLLSSVISQDSASNRAIGLFVRWWRGREIYLSFCLFLPTSFSIGFLFCWIFMRRLLVSTIKMFYNASNPPNGGITSVFKKDEGNPFALTDPTWKPGSTVKSHYSHGWYVLWVSWQLAHDHCKPWSAEANPTLTFSCPQGAAQHSCQKRLWHYTLYPRSEHPPQQGREITKHQN